MDNTGCAYCFEGEALDKFGIKICELPASKLYLFKEQSHKGRVTDEERDAYFADIAHVARALHRAFHPDKINYGAYGDTGCHLHFHLVPKYKDGFEWGGVFAMNPAEKHLTDAEYAALIEMIKANL